MGSSSTWENPPPALNFMKCFRLLLLALNRPNGLLRDDVIFLFLFLLYFYLLKSERT